MQSSLLSHVTLPRLDFGGGIETCTEPNESLALRHVEEKSQQV